MSSQRSPAKQNEGKERDAANVLTKVIQAGCIQGKEAEYLFFQTL